MPLNDARYTAGRHRVLERNPWLLGLLGSPLLVAIALLVPGHPIKFGLLWVAVPVFLFGIVAWAKNLWPSTVETTVTANRSALRLGARVIPCSRIREGHVIPRRDDRPPRVVIQRRRRLPIVIEVASAAEGSALLRALGLDPSRTLGTFRALSPLIAKRPYLAPLMQFVINLSLQIFLRPMLHREGLGLVGALAMLGILSSALFVMMTTRVLVGADGVVLRWLWRERFVPYRDIGRIANYARGKWPSKVSGVKLVLTSGEAIRLAITNRREIADSTRGLSARIHAAWSAQEPSGSQSAAALLRRQGRGMTAWISGLRALGAGANADMRTAPIPRERLFRVVEDASIDPTTRAAAAVALGLELDDDGRASLHSAIAAMAAPKLRFAIEEAASPHAADDRAIEAALAELEIEEAKTAP